MHIFAKTIASRRDYESRTDLTRLSRSWRGSALFGVLGRHGSLSFWTCVPFYTRRTTEMTVLWQLANEYGAFESSNSRVMTIGMAPLTLFRLGRLFGFLPTRDAFLWEARIEVIRGFREGEIRLGDEHHHSISRIAGLLMLQEDSF